MPSSLRSVFAGLGLLLASTLACQRFQPPPPPQPSQQPIPQPKTTESGGFEKMAVKPQPVAKDSALL